MTPTLLVISVPLTLFATLTTMLAFSTLFIRALVVYAELAAALIQSRFTSSVASKSNQVSADASSARRGSRHIRRSKSRRSSVASQSSNGGSVTPKFPESSGLGIYSGGGVARDFEGVGGWRLPGSDDEDTAWANLNSRLELPAIVDGHERHHHRSRTSGSLTTMPVPVSPVRSRTRTPTASGVALSASPEGYFGQRPSSKSTTALDAANIGKALLRHKPSSSSVSSQGSARTLSITTSNT